MKSKSTWFAKKVVKIDKKLRYESTSRIIVEMTMSVSVSILINLFYGKADDPINAISYITAIALLIMLMLILAYTTIFPMIYISKINTHPDYFERHAFLFLDFRTSNVK